MRYVYLGDPMSVPLADWPNCATPDCQFKSCRWAGLGLCYGCSVFAIGRKEMDRRYDATRLPSGEWNGKLAADTEA
jgi:hypothetical protein